MEQTRLVQYSEPEFSKRHFYFGRLYTPEQINHIEIDVMGNYTITQDVIALQMALHAMTSLIKKSHSYHRKTTFRAIDMTAGIGGNLLVLPRIFDQVYGIEMSPTRWAYLLHNCKNILSSELQSKITLVCENSDIVVKRMQKPVGTFTAYFFDPSWDLEADPYTLSQGGVKRSRKNSNVIDLQFCGKSIWEYIQKFYNENCIGKHGHHIGSVVIKLPNNFDEYKFRRYIGGVGCIGEMATMFRLPRFSYMII